MTRASIERNVAELLAELPHKVKVVAAAKARTLEEVPEAVEAGIKIIGKKLCQGNKRGTNHVGWHFLAFQTIPSPHSGFNSRTQLENLSKANSLWWVVHLRWDVMLDEAYEVLLPGPCKTKRRSDSTTYRQPSTSD